MDPSVFPAVFQQNRHDFGCVHVYKVAVATISGNLYVKRPAVKLY